ncbi:hypothetical protein A9Q81_05320 [Gammaproteobacteria bacterium 42_54_T18]|nr:hypothetical protein A9Q81_05320 [Gammaproteobacteria bacterium 42_54_T18]
MFTQQRQHTQRMTFLVAACLVVWFSMLPSTSHAVLTDNLGIGNAKAISLGHAVTADPPGIDSIHYNPAGLAKLKGRQRQVKVVTGSFAIEMEMGDYNSDRYQLLDLVDQAIIDQNLDLPDDFLFDESKNSTSQTEGASMMIPVLGLTDLPVLLFPLGGASYSAPGSNITFGTNVYTPMAMGFYRSDDDPGRFIGQRMSFMMLTYFSPSIAIQVNDEFSVGASINFNYVGVGLELPFRSPHAGILALAGVQDLSGCGSGDPLFDDFCGVLNPYDVIGTLTFEVEKELTFGFNIGFLWEPTPWVAFGVVYQSPVAMDMEGDYKWVNEDGWVDFIGPLTEGAAGAIVKGVIGIQGDKVSEGTAYLDMTYPEHLSFGVSLQITPRFKVNVDYKFTAWSEWASIPVEFSNSIDLLALASVVPDNEGTTPTNLTFPLGLEDTWNFAIGFEFALSDRIDLRFGIEDRPSSIPKASRSPLLPISDARFYGTGVGIKLESGAQLDIGMAYLHSEVEMPGGTSELGNSNNPQKVIYNPFPGQDITASVDAFLFELSYREEF